jgi:hypothetical protein
VTELGDVKALIGFDGDPASGGCASEEGDVALTLPGHIEFPEVRCGEEISDLGSLSVSRGDPGECWREDLQNKYGRRGGPGNERRTGKTTSPRQWLPPSLQKSES